MRKSFWGMWLAVATVLVMSLLGTWDMAEYALQDRLYQEDRPPVADIVIIAIDEKSLQALGQWPWPRKTHTRLLERLQQAGVRAVGFDLIFAEPDRSIRDDAELAATLSRYRNVVLPVHVNGTDAITPLPDFTTQSHIGHIHIVRDTDGVVRRHLPYVEADGMVYPAFSLRLAQLVMETHDVEDVYPGSASKHPQPIRFVGGPGHFEQVSYVDVLNGQIPLPYFSGKTVLIGAAASGLNDMHLTAADKNVPMTGVEIHANLLQNYLQGSHAKYPPPWVHVLVICLAGWSGWLVFRRLSTVRSAMALACLMTGYTAAAYGFSRVGCYLQLFYPLLMLVFAYWTSVAVKYAEEYRLRQQVTTAFSRYVAPPVVKEIIRLGEPKVLAETGNRRIVTVMFVDIRGFTSLAEQADSGDVVRLLNSFLDGCSDILFQYGGTLDKFMGDGIMALFNAPLEQEDHVVRAVTAAIAIQKRAIFWRDHTSIGKPLSVGIGIHTGEAIVGNIGSLRRMDYTAIGDTVNLAARLEELADGGQIVISEAVYRELPGRFQVEPVGLTPIRGRREPVSLYVVSGTEPG